MKLFFPFLLALLSISFYSHSQGCNDAGACSVGSMNILPFKYELLVSEKRSLSKLDTNKQELVLKKQIKYKSPTDSLAFIYSSNTILKYSFQLTQYYGSGPQSTSIYTTQLESNVNIIENKLYAQLKIPYTFINGKLGSVNGLSDFTLSLSYSAFNNKNANLSFSGGVKIPSNKANTHKDNLPLPMVYQTSLGSTDILLGVKYAYKKWDVTAGYQHSFNATENAYLNTTSTGANVADYKSYEQSNKMKRADDVIFRLTRNFYLKNTLTSTGILFIYHVANDKITDATGNRMEVIGSNGLTINLTLSGVIPISKKADFIFVLAAPVINRSIVPDGLIRQFVCIGGIKFNIYKNKI